MARALARRLRWMPSIMTNELPAAFGHVDLDDLDLAADDELDEFDSALSELPRSGPPGSCPPEG